MSDLQTKLISIERRADQVKQTYRPGTNDKEKIQELAYLVSYLSGLLRKHLEANER